MSEFADETRLVPDSLTAFRQFILRAPRTAILRGGQAYRTLAGRKRIVLKGAVSSLNGVTWKQGKLDAECLNELRDRTHSAPQRDCHCGIYALLFPAIWMYPHLYVADKEQTVQLTVNGVIRAQGRTTVGELGIRTQQAEIAAITVPGILGDRVDSIIGMLADLHPSIQLFRDHDLMYEAFPEADLNALFGADTRHRMQVARNKFLGKGLRYPPRGPAYEGDYDYDAVAYPHI